MAEREGPLAAGAEARTEPLVTTRRGFLAYMVAGSSTLLVGGAFLTADAEAETLGLPELADIVDLGDLLILAEAPYRYNLRLEVTADNRVRFELPRLDKGQGIATALAMVIADELDADYDRTDVDLSDARADRPFTITGSSSTIRFRSS
jgi:isoquinoline 1-oxidoreductase beta subunit